jgi:recombination protein RecA
MAAKQNRNDDNPRNPADAKLKAIEATILTIERVCGKGSVMRLTDRPVEKMDVIPTGSLGLDIALGVGGLPRGRIIELYGPESSGKTTLALHAIANAQRSGGYALLIDAEHAYDPGYGAKLGVDASRLYISQPDYGEQGLHIADQLISSGAVDLVVVDSVAALVPKAELEGDMGDTHVGLQARMMSQAMRKLTATAHRTGTCVIFINQIREKIGVMFGSPETTPGGRALKFFASVRLEIRRTTQVKEGDVAIGVGAKVSVKKNKVAPPFRSCEIEIIFNKGISYIAELLSIGSELGVIGRTGNWYTFGDVKLGNGKAKAQETLSDPANIKLFETIDAAVKAQVFSNPDNAGALHAVDAEAAA